MRREGKGAAKAAVRGEAVRDEAGTAGEAGRRGAGAGPRTARPRAAGRKPAGGGAARATGAQAIDTRAMVRLLRRLLRGALPLGVDEQGQPVLRLPGEARLPVAAAVLEEMERRDLIARQPGGIAATAAGLSWLRRALAGAGAPEAPTTPFRLQHGCVVADAEGGREAGAGETGAAPGDGALRDMAESPLGWLGRRSGRNGQPLLDGAQVEAGERLRRDFTRGGLSPRLTQGWGEGGGTLRRSGARGAVADLTDAAVDARGRFAAAMEAVGPELSGVLADVCCFLKGLETVERERGWPARSAKIVLALALRRLAGHYGLDAMARGRERGRMRHWGTADYRPGRRAAPGT